MAIDYFSNFPKVRYYNILATNITLRTAFIETLKLNSAVFYPYVIQDGETADIIATWYYGAPNYDWMVYLANNIIDPHTEWPKTLNQFDSYIKKKYGSVEEAKSKIEFYRKNPDVAYLFTDGSGFTTSANNAADRVLTNTDIRITPTTYSLIEDQINYFPVYAYDYEEELNEQRRNILLIDNTLKSKITNELSNLLNG